jgi:hypothetical protein
MTERVPNLQVGQITVTYLNPPAADNTCTSANCKAVSVRLSGYVHQTIIPLVPLSLTLPPFATTLRKEFMDSTGNAVCS